MADVSAVARRPGAGHVERGNAPETGERRDKVGDSAPRPEATDESSQAGGARAPSWSQPTGDARGVVASSGASDFTPAVGGASAPGVSLSSIFAAAADHLAKTAAGTQLSKGLSQPEDGGLVRSGPPDEQAILQVRHDFRDLAAQRRLATRALDSLEVVADSHPYRQHIEEVRKELAARGLPANASGVKVLIAGEFTSESRPNYHVDASLRTVAHRDIGIAPGALCLPAVDDDRPFSERGDADPTFFPAVDRWENGHYRIGMEHMHTCEAHIAEGAAPLSLLGRAGANELLLAQSKFAGDLANLKTNGVRQDGGVTIASFSVGSSIARVTRECTLQAAKAPVGSLLHDEVCAALKLPAKSDLIPHAKEVERLVSAQVEEFIQRPACQQALAAGSKKIEELMSGLLDQNVVVFVSSGNEGRWGHREDGSDAHSVLYAPSAISVGAVDFRESMSTEDDSAADFSSGAPDGGALALAPGVNMPVGSAGHVEISGTSFAAPYLAGVAALMVKANPDLSARDVRSILSQPYVYRDVPQKGRALGAIDVVAAVEAARDFRSSPR